MTKFDTLISETPSIKEYIYPIRYINLNAFLIISIQSLTNYFHYLYACIFDLSGRDNKNRRQTKYFSSPRSFSWCFSRCARSRKKKNLQEEEQETNFRGGRCRILGERGVGDCSRNRKWNESVSHGGRKEWENDREKVLVVRAPL